MENAHGRRKKKNCFPWTGSGRGLPLHRKIPRTVPGADGTVLLEIQGSEYMINKLLVGLNHNQFITIEWIDTEIIPLEEESGFMVR